MNDKMTRFFLMVAIVVIGLLLLRPASTSPVAQLPVHPNQVQPVMVADNATLYVLSNNKVYVYFWDGVATKEFKAKIGKLRLMQTLDARLK
jgi:hypothetical protein